MTGRIISREKTVKTVFAVLQIVFYAISLVLLLIAGILLLHARNVIGNGVRADAVIADIEISGHGESRTHRVTVEFRTENGEAVRTVCGWYISGMETGDIVPIYYEKEKPERIISANHPYLAPMILSAVALPFLIVAGSFTGISLAKKAKRGLLLTGAPEAVTVTELRTNYNVTVNRAFHPVVIYAADVSGTVYRSENIYGAPSGIAPGTRLTVYIDRRRPKRYYMDWENPEV